MASDTIQRVLRFIGRLSPGLAGEGQLTGMQTFKPLLIGFLLAVSGAGEGRTGTGPPDPSSAPSPTKRGAPRKLIPWIEVNAPRSPIGGFISESAGAPPETEFRDFCLGGLPFWKEVTDTVIVTTTAGNAPGLYPYLMRHKPAGMHVIGGMKTYFVPGAAEGDDRPYDYADPQSWQRVSDVAQRITQLTGNNVIVLENETALAPFHIGKGTIDFDKLRRSLEPLKADGVQYWWHGPSVMGSTANAPNRERDTTLLVKTLAEALPDSIFLTAYTHRMDWHQNRKNQVDSRGKMIQLVGHERIKEQLLVTLDGWQQYPGKKLRTHSPAESLSEMDKLPGSTFILYPGASRWITVGRAFAELKRTPNSDETEERSLSEDAGSEGIVPPTADRGKR